MDPSNKPALTIVIQSWTTPLIGLVMLLCGLATGFLLRPLLAAQPAESEALNQPAPTARSARPTATKSVPINTVQPSPTSDSAGVVSAFPTPDTRATQQAVINNTIAQTRHFKGNPDAPITMLEFSDFQ